MQGFCFVFSLGQEQVFVHLQTLLFHPVVKLQLQVETVYPLFLGANIGTTTTGILAALAGSGKESIQNSLHISFVHLFFNVIGILIFYPVKFMRVPIPLCKILGNTTAEYRWFALVYLFGMFLILPLAVMVSIRW